MSQSPTCSVLIHDMVSLKYYMHARGKWVQADTLLQELQSWAEGLQETSRQQSAQPSPGGRIPGELPLPEPLGLALNALWLAESMWTEEIETCQAGVQELVQRRFKP